MKATLNMIPILLAGLSAQDLVPMAAPQSQPILITNAVIHPVTGPVIDGGSILFEGGKITAIGRSASPPSGAQVIDVGGKHVYPGLVTPQSNLGLTEIGSVPMTNDTSELGNFKAEVRAAVAVNSDATAIPVARANGILVSGTFPGGGVISGRASAMTTDGWSWEEMTLRPDIGLVVSWPRQQAQRQELDDYFADARAWNQAKATDATLPVDLRYQSMASCLRGETKVFLMANDLEAIRSAVQWAVRNELDPVIVGGRDSDLCTDLLRRHGVEVVIGSVFGTPRRRDSDYDEAFRLPKILHDAGVKFCIGAGGGATKARDIPFHAGMAVGFGLEEDEAIKAITLYSARALGVDDRVGSLEIGKDATLIVTNGSPLDLTTDVEMAFISGRKVDLRSKHTELDRKYREKYRQIKDKK